MRFDHDTLPQRVRFASDGAAENLAAELEDLGARRAMVIAGDPERAMAERIAGDLPVSVWHHDVVMHVPVETAVRARAVAAEHGVDVLISVGGGSAVGLAKAVALTSALPIVAVPTTYAGSEATNVWGLTEAGRKTTGVDRRVLPRAVVYDATLTTSLPAAMSVASGLNAMAHCVDSMWAPRADPINAALAGEAIRALHAGLPQVLADPKALPGRERTLYGAHLAAVAFASAGSGMHHKICHVLGGMFDLPHAQTHAAVLPHVLAFNADGAPDAEHRVARALDAPSAREGLVRLYADLSAPRALRDLGMPEDGISTAAQAALTAIPAGNPVPVTIDNLNALLHTAWEGAMP